jgi:hypothetical protein
MFFLFPFSFKVKLLTNDINKIKNEPMKSFKIIESEKGKHLLVSVFENEILTLYLTKEEENEVFFHSERLKEEEVVSRDVLLNSFEQSGGGDLFELKEWKKDTVELIIKFILKKGGSYQGASFSLKKKNIPMMELFMLMSNILMEWKKENQQLKSIPCVFFSFLVLSKERNEAVKLSESLIQEREEKENQLLSSFLTILNTKKKQDFNDLLDQSF